MRYSPEPNDAVADPRALDLARVARYKKLEVWQKAHALALNVYRVAAPIKGAHHISLRSQLIRAAMSIPTNIVEGRGQQSDKDFARFLRYSISSASELEYHLDVARDIGIISRSDSDSLVDQTVVFARCSTVW